MDDNRSAEAAILSAGQADGSFVRLPGFLLTSTGLIPGGIDEATGRIEGKPSIEQVIESGRMLNRFYHASLWGIADWIEYVRLEYETNHAQIVAATGMSYSTITKAVWLGRKFPKHERVDGVSPSVHEAVATLKPQDRAAVLTRVREEDLPRTEVRAIVRDVSRGIGTPADITVVTVSTSDVASAAWSLASAFGKKLPALASEIAKLAGGQYVADFD